MRKPEFKHLVSFAFNQAWHIGIFASACVCYWTALINIFFITTSDSLHFGCVLCALFFSYYYFYFLEPNSGFHYRRDSVETYFHTYSLL